MSGRGALGFGALKKFRGKGHFTDTLGLEIAEVLEGGVEELLVAGRHGWDSNPQAGVWRV